MHDNHDPLAEAFIRCAAEGGGTDEVWHFPLDHSKVLLGYPGLYDGLVLSHWTQDGDR